MKSRLLLHRLLLMRSFKMNTQQVLRLLRAVALLAMLGIAGPVFAASAPDWMRAQINMPLPAHDEKADSVLLFSETILTVQPSGKIKRLYRNVFKILRPAGEERGLLNVIYDDQSRITFMRAWCIPAAGKDYEIKEKDAVESAVLGVNNGELAGDIRSKILRIPAATPGNIVGYEVEQEHRPYMSADQWDIQETVPVRETRYRLQLPPGWTYKTAWLNHAELAPTSTGANQWQWVLNDVKAIRLEDNMPPWRGVAAGMFVSLIPPNGQAGMQSWNDIGVWYANLARERRDTSPELKRQVAELTADKPTLLAKMQALASFAQANIRYVAIEIGIGGFQPHPATYILKNRFGDCKDKATLLSVMLKEIGVESYYVIINTERGSVGAKTPPNLGFNHAILAIALPMGLDDATLMAQVTHPKVGRILFFDPTDELTPFGRISGNLQSNFGLVVTPDGGDLVELPKLPTTLNTIERTADMTLDANGTLHGDINEVWSGDLAAMQRYAMRSATLETDWIKPVESALARSMTSFVVEKATVGNLSVPNKPFEWHYTVQATGYAKVAGDLLLVRPRVLGTKARGLLETKEPREHPVEFERPERHKDVFEIALPAGFEVDELPAAVNVDNGFIAYQSKTEVVGRKLRFTRTFEVKELSVPVAEVEKLKKFYRTISGDERNVAVLKRVGP